MSMVLTSETCWTAVTPPRPDTPTPTRQPGHCEAQSCEICLWSCLETGDYAEFGLRFPVLHVCRPDLRKWKYWAFFWGTNVNVLIYKKIEMVHRGEQQTFTRQKPHRAVVWMLAASLKFKSDAVIHLKASALLQAPERQRRGACVSSRRGHTFSLRMFHRISAHKQQSDADGWDRDALWRWSSLLQEVSRKGLFTEEERNISPEETASTQVWKMNFKGSPGQLCEKIISTHFAFVWPFAGFKSEIGIK